MKNRLTFPTLVLLCVIPFTVLAQQSDSTQPRVAVTKLADHIYKLECRDQFSVNVVASISPDGTLLIDAGRPQTSEVLRR
ncbi:MAG: hypothetical protein NTW07_12325, partial [candidate division Zixibacteria bacterium]|nr:hypothetical protein [candidate division Zixibacteria bacterium]